MQLWCCVIRAYEATLQLLSLYREPSDDELPSKQVAWHREMLAGKLSLTMGNQKEAHHRLLLLVKELEANRKLLDFLQEYVNESNSCEDYEHLWVSAMLVATICDKNIILKLSLLFYF